MTSCFSIATMRSSPRSSARIRDMRGKALSRCWFACRELHALTRRRGARFFIQKH